MTPEVAKQTVYSVLQAVETSLGVECPPLEMNTVPLNSLPKFDSPTSIAATGIVARKLGIEVPPETNLFGDKSGKYTISKTIGIICKLADAKEPAHA